MISLASKPVWSCIEPAGYSRLQQKRARINELFSLNQQRPILPARFQTSTFGVWVLNYCVRYGNRWYHSAIVTGYYWMNHVHSKLYRRNHVSKHFSLLAVNICQSSSPSGLDSWDVFAYDLLPNPLRFLDRSVKLSPRFISIGPLNTLRCLHSQPIYLVFFKGSYWITPWDTSSRDRLHA